MAIGLSRRTLSKRIGEEQKAQSDYGKNLAEAKRKKDTKSAKVIGHIRGEEREHESMLRKVGAKWQNKTTWQQTLRLLCLTRSRNHRTILLLESTRLLIILRSPLQNCQRMPRVRSCNSTSSAPKRT